MGELLATIDFTTFSFVKTSIRLINKALSIVKNLWW